MTSTPNEGGFYKVEEQVKRPYSPIKPNFFLNLWPFEEYTVLMFLKIDDNVKIRYAKPIDSYEQSEMANNPNWDIRTVADESSIDEMNNNIPDIKPNEDILSVFKFEVVMSHSNDYKIKHIIYP